MTVNSNYKPMRFTQAGQGPYEFDFEVIQESDVTVFLDGKLVEDGYTVTLYGEPRLYDGGNVVFTDDISQVAFIQINRCTDLTQLVDYVAYDPFPAETHEFALDKLTLQQQEQAMSSCGNCGTCDGEEPLVRSPMCMANEDVAAIPGLYCISYIQNISTGPAVLHTIPADIDGAGSYSWTLHEANGTPRSFSFAAAGDRGLLIAPNNPLATDDLAYATVNYVNGRIPEDGGIGDAPIDGQQYGRQNASWTVITSGGGGDGDFLPLAGGVMTGPIGWSVASFVPTAEMIFGNVSSSPLLSMNVEANGIVPGTFAVNIDDGQGATKSFVFGALDFSAPSQGALPTLQLPATPHAEDSLAAATVQFVLDNGGGGGGDFLPLAGGTMDPGAGIKWDVAANAGGLFSFGNLGGGNQFFMGADPDGPDPSGTIRFSVVPKAGAAFTVDGDANILLADATLTETMSIQYANLNSAPFCTINIPFQGLTAGAFGINLGINGAATSSYLFTDLDFSAGAQGRRSTLQLPAVPHNDDLLAAATVSYVNDAIGAGGGIPEAPNDGTQYGRQNQSWTEIIAGSGGDFLPLAGGVMDAGAQILFASSTAEQGILSLGNVGAGDQIILGVVGAAELPISLVTATGKQLAIETTGQISGQGKPAATTAEHMLAKSDGDALYLPLGDGPFLPLAGGTMDEGGAINMTSNTTAIGTLTVDNFSGGEQIFLGATTGSLPIGLAPAVGAALVYDTSGQMTVTGKPAASADGHLLAKSDGDQLYVTVGGANDFLPLAGGTMTSGAQIEWDAATGANGFMSWGDAGGGFNQFLWASKTSEAVGFSWVPAAGIGLSLTADGTFRLVGSAPVTNNDDILTKGDGDTLYLSAADGPYLPLSAGANEELTGDLFMGGGNQIKELSAGTATTDAVNKAQLDAVEDAIPTDFYTQQEVDDAIAAAIAGVRQLPVPTIVNATLHVNNAGTAWEEDDTVIINSTVGVSVKTGLATVSTISSQGDIIAFLGS